jgi:hypothetical protein
VLKGADEKQLLRELCDQAAKEQNAEKLMRLADQIVQLMDSCATEAAHCGVGK